MADDTSAATVVPWSTVWVTLVISIAVGVVFYAIFLHLYRKHASKNDHTLFETRQYHYSSRSPPPFESTSWGASLLHDYRLSNEDLLRCIGLDSYMFLRFLRMGFRASLVGTLLGCFILIPIYATAEATGLQTEEFNSITLAHVSSSSPRLWASVVCWALFILFVLHEIHVEWKEFGPKRRDFMACGDVDTERDYRYTCLVENLPIPLRSNHALRKYFDKIFPNQIHQANVLVHAEHLEKLVQQRQTLILQCESAIAMTHAKPDKPPPTCKVNGGILGLGGTTVEAIPYYQDEIRRLNEEIDKERAALCRFADATHLQDTSTRGSKLLTSLLLKSIKTEETAVDTEGTKEKKNDVKATKAESKQDEDGPVNNVNIESSDHDPFSIERTFSDEIGLLSDTDDAAVNKKHASSDHNEAIHEGEASSTGFITFTSLRAKQTAIQCEVSGKVDDVDVVPAPLPNSIIWKNALVPISTQRFVSMVAAAFWLVGCLFWAVPVAFVTGIANLNSILASFGIAPLDPDTFYYGLISGILPVAFLQLLMIFLYLAIGACAMHGIRFKSMPEVDTYTFFWHQLFQFANLWLILIGGSIFGQIDALIKNADPGAIASILAAALPGASAFFLNMMIMGSFLMFGVELSMIATYGVKLIMNILQPEAQKTQRMLDDEKKPPSIVWGKILPPMVFILLVAFVYMPIVPLMEPFACVYFGGWYLVWKHQCLHVYNQEFEGGGLLWNNIFGFIMACLYTAEVVVIAYMGLKESLGPTIFSLIPFVCTILVHYHLRRNTVGPLKNLSLEAAAEVDMNDSELRISEDENGPTAVIVERQLYGQPCLKARDEEREPMPYRRTVAMVEAAETAPPTTETEELEV